MIKQNRYQIIRKLNTIETLIDLYISHDEFVLENKFLRE